MTTADDHGRDWDEDQEWERNWWGSCVNTFAEETKQLSYAHRMGLIQTVDYGKWPVYDLAGKSVLDIGGGPTSMLLKTSHGGRMVVADPCDYPEWVMTRYEVHGVEFSTLAGEDVHNLPGHFDEVWIYNVLQHVRDPKAIIANARLLGDLVRIFEWIDIPPHVGHPHELKAYELSAWLGGMGTVEQMNENGCNGRAFYGYFKGV